MNLLNAIASTAILLALCCHGPRIVLCGNEVFSSLAQLESLRYKDTLLASSVEFIIKNLCEPPHELKE